MKIQKILFKEDTQEIEFPRNKMDIFNKATPNVGKVILSLEKSWQGNNDITNAASFLAKKVEIWNEKARNYMSSADSKFKKALDQVITGKVFEKKSIENWTICAIVYNGWRYLVIYSPDSRGAIIESP